jgi:hypothetical protein
VSRTLDVRQWLRTGRAFSLDEPATLEELRRRADYIAARVKEVVGEDGKTRYDHRCGKDVEWEALDVSESVFRSMRLGHNLFRIRQSDPVLIGCSVRGDPAFGFGHILLGYPDLSAYVARWMPVQDAAIVKAAATDASKWTADLDLPDAAVASLSPRSLDTARAEHLLVRAGEEGYLRLKEIDAYDVRANERLTIWGCADTLLVRNAKTTGGEVAPATNGNEYARLGKWLWREGYWEGIQILVLRIITRWGHPSPKSSRSWLRCGGWSCPAAGRTIRNCACSSDRN